jgi:hypothetical protein
MSPASADEAPSGSRCSRPVLEDASSQVLLQPAWEERP